MQTLKTILLILGVVGLLVVAISQFLPGHYHTERNTIIAAKPEAIFPLVNNVKKWTAWTPWSAAKDPTLVNTYEGPDEGVGATSKWTSKKFSEGSMKVTESDPSKLIKFDLSFQQGSALANATFKFEPSGENTRVTWSMDGESGRNPLKRIFGVLMAKMIGPDFEEGLRNLKTQAEAK